MSKVTVLTEKGDQKGQRIEESRGQRRREKLSQGGEVTNVGGGKIETEMSQGNTGKGIKEGAEVRLQGIVQSN